MGERAFRVLSPRRRCPLQLELIRSTLDSQMSALRYIDSEAQQLTAVAHDVATSLQERAQRIMRSRI